MWLLWLSALECSVRRCHHDGFSHLPPGTLQMHVTPFSETLFSFAETIILVAHDASSLLRVESHFWVAGAASRPHGR